MFVSFVALLPACAPKSPTSAAKTAEPQPVAVTLAPVGSVSLKRTVQVVGTLDAFKDVTLAPKVDGRVVRVRKDRGDAVQPGEVLLELDAKDYELDVEVARRALEAELAKLDLRALPAGDIDIEQVTAVAQARAQLDLSKKELDRMRTLDTRGVGARADLDSALTKVTVAEATKRLAETEARATLAHARRLRATLDLAEQRLRDTVVRAPVPDEWGAWAAVVGPGFSPLTYTVANRMVWEGEMVRGMPEKNVFRLVIAHVLKLRAEVPEKFGPEVRAGQTVEVRVDAFAGRAFAGVVARVSPTVDTQNRTFQVEIEVPNCDPKFKLKPGGFAQADILTRTDANVLTVPVESVVTFAGVTKIFVADGDRAKAIEVKLGQRDKDWVEVIGPVPSGAKVVTSGFSQLVDGSLIRVRNSN
ncbi:MAG TPA: efflux RND transporter periplasmic adaptor subunit [Gemmataceae bacterium]|nr:efflux RND transporter periplasmic adaptor subunit [Gemmataceae bacterium]